MNRLIAIGDIHGQRKLLTDLLYKIQPTQEDQFVFLGDYIDRGPDSRGVIEDLIDFQLLYPRTVFLRGNHEQMFLDSLIDCDVIKGKRLEDLSEDWAREMMRDTNVQLFKNNGGDKTLSSYGTEMVRDSSDDSFWPKYIMIGDLPDSHIEFIQQTTFIYQQGSHIFVHAGIDRTIERLEEQEPDTQLWDRSLDHWPHDERILVIGHTPCPEGKPLISENLIMLDTGAAYGRPLTAMDVLSGRIWQAEPVRPDWLSTKYEPPNVPSHIILLDNKNNKEIPAYFDGQDCVIGGTNTPLEKFSFWRPEE